MTPSTQANVRDVFESATAYQTTLQVEFNVLLISGNFDSRRTISKILEALSIQVISCSSLSQARQVLALQRPNLIFCDERLPDGSYTDLLDFDSESPVPPPVVVLTRTGEWELYMDATRRGAFDVIRSPWCPTDIELSLIRAAREEKQNKAKAMR
jgi:DNA-binding NtrC family response regulator